MPNKKNDAGFQSWFSTYGLLTVDRILEYLSIKLSHENVSKLLSDPNHVLHRVINVPLRSIFNGIIFQQAYDYQVYAQKLMIDYRLSPEYAKEPESPGANIREDLNAQYDQLLSMVKAFTDHQYQHYQIISESQSYLIERMGQLRNPATDLDILQDDDEFNENIKGFTQRAEEMMLTFRSYRTQFYDLILAISERLASLSEYQFDVAEATRERETLFFDRAIGED